MKNKRILSLVLAFAMLLGTFSFAFADEVVEPSENIKKLQELGLVEGDAGTGDLRLKDNIKRSEVAVIVAKAYELQKEAEGLKAVQGPFKDVNPTHWANGYINVLVGKKILNGYPDGTFKPDANITYSEFVTIMVMMIDEGKAPAGKYPFNMIARAAELGLTDGVEIANFEAVAIREKVFEIFFNTITKKDANLVIANTVEGIVVENYRTERLAADEITVHVMKDQVQREGKYYEKDDEFKINITPELKKKGLDVETLLGQVVTVSFDKNGKVVDVKPVDGYNYVQGEINEIRDKEIKVDGRWYTVVKDEGREKTVDERLYQVYFNNEDLHYYDEKDFDRDGKVVKNPRSFAGKAVANDIAEYARLTVRNGKVLFIDAYAFDDIAPVAKDVEDGTVVEYYDDTDGGEISKLKRVNSAYVITFEENEMKLGNYKDIKANDVIHWYTDARDNTTIFVRPFDDNKVEGKYVDASARKAKDDSYIFIKVDDNEYPALIRTKNRNSVYSTLASELLFETLTEDYDEQLEGFEKQEVTLLRDMFGFVQLIGSETLDGSFFAMVSNTSRSHGEIKLLRTDGEDEWYGTTRDTVFRIAGNTKDKQFDDIDKYDLVKVTVTEDKMITSIEKHSKDGKDVNEISKDVIDFFDKDGKVVDPAKAGESFWYLSKNVVVFVEGRNPMVMDIATFLKNYYKPGDTDYVAYEKDEEGNIVKDEDGHPVRKHLISAYEADVTKGDVARIIVVKKAVPRSAGTKPLRAEVQKVRFTGGNYWLTLLYGDNETVKTHMIIDDVKYVNNRELAIDGELIKAGDIIEVQLTKDDNELITSIERVKLEPARKVGKFGWDDNRRQNFVRFADKETPELIWISKDADQFGRIEIGKWVRYADKDRYDVVGLIAVVDGPTEDEEDKLPEGAVEYKGIGELDGNNYIYLGDKAYPFTGTVPADVEEGDLVIPTFVTIRDEKVVKEIKKVEVETPDDPEDPDPVDPTEPTATVIWEKVGILDGFGHYKVSNVQNVEGAAKYKVIYTLANGEDTGDTNIVAIGEFTEDGHPKSFENKVTIVIYAEDGTTELARFEATFPEP